MVDAEGKINLHKDKRFLDAQESGWEASSYEEDGGMSALEKLGVAAQSALVNTVEYSALESVIAKSGILETEDDSPYIDAKQAKELYDLDLPEGQYNKAELVVLNQMKQDKIELAIKFAEATSFEDGYIEPLAAWGTAALLSSMTPIAQASGWAAAKTGSVIGTALSPVAGTAIGGAVGYLGGLTAKGAHTVKVLKAMQKIGNLAKLAKKGADISGVSKAVNTAYHAAKNNAAAKNILAGATGNSMEEAVIWWIEKNKGYKTDLAPNMAYGFFAPAILGAGVASLAGLGRVASPIIKNQFIAMGEAGAIGGSKSKMEKLSRKLLEKGDLADELSVRKEMDRIAVENENFGEYLFAMQDVFGIEISGINRAIEAVGEFQFKNHFINLFIAMRNSRVSPHIFEMFSQLKSRKAFNIHLKNTANRLGLKYDHVIRDIQWAEHIDELFSMKESDMAKYLDKYTFKDNAPNKRNMDNITNLDDYREKANPLKIVKDYEQKADNKPLAEIINLKEAANKKANAKIQEFAPKTETPKTETAKPEPKEVDLKTYITGKDGTASQKKQALDIYVKEAFEDTDLVDFAKESLEPYLKGKPDWKSVAKELERLEANMGVNGFKNKMNLFVDDVKQSVDDFIKCKDGTLETSPPKNPRPMDALTEAKFRVRDYSQKQADAVKRNDLEAASLYGKRLQASQRSVEDLTVEARDRKIVEESRKSARTYTPEKEKALRAEVRKMKKQYNEAKKRGDELEMGTAKEYFDEAQKRLKLLLEYKNNV